jgi:hypothetical protein
MRGAIGHGDVPATHTPTNHLELHKKSRLSKGKLSMQLHIVARLIARWLLASTQSEQRAQLTVVAALPDTAG